MTQESFIHRRLPLWERVEAIISGGKKAVEREATWFPLAFRELTQDLNTARAHGFDPAVIDRINRLVAEGNQILYGRKAWSLRFLARFILETFPRTVRRHSRGILAAHLLFYGVALFIGYLCVQNPEAVYDFIPEMQAASIEKMYDPGDASYLKPSDVSSSADMFGFYIYNNISIAFRTFAGGILAGVGSLFFLVYNALFLGAAAAHILNSGLALTFFPFIIAHGAFELTAIILSAWAGLLLGFSLFVTRGLPRAASLKAAAAEAVPIIGGSSLFLVVAACLEAFWSSRHNLPPAVRFGSGGAMWLLVALYFIFSGRKGR